MEEEEQNQAQTDTGQSDWEQFAAEQGGFSASTGGFGSLTAYPKRVFVDFDPAVSQQQRQAILQQVSYYGKPGGKEAAPIYSGEFLINERRQIARAPYGEEDVYNELYAMRDGERLSTLRLLQSRGFYGTGKPSATGTLSKDRTAFKEFLSYANAKGYTWKPLLQELITAGPVYAGAGGAGSRYRTSPSENVAEYLRTASLEKLGRTMSKADIDKAIAAIQQQEATRGPSAPALSVMAGQQVSQLQGGAEKAVRFRKAIDAAMSIVG
jgi:hypothetical protein